MNFKNQKYSINFNEKGDITSLLSNGKEFIGKVLPLFQFRMRKGAKVSIYNSDMADNIVLKNESDKVNIEYEYNDIAFSIIVEINLKDTIDFSFCFCNKSRMILEWIDLPYIAVPNDLVRNGGSGRILSDINEGLIVEDITSKEAFYPYKYKEMEYPSLGLYAMFPAVVESQFLAYYDDTAGLYFAAEDTERSIKGVDFLPCGDDAIKLQIRLYPGVDNKTEDYTLPFKTVFDFFEGDWHDAANLYRSWFESNLPENCAKIADNKTLPEWYTDSPLIVTYPVQGIHDMDEAKPNRLFPYNNALPFLEDISKETKSRVMALLMHWEGTAPWAPPYVWPPLGGEDMLHEFGEALHKRDFLLGVYCSGISYTMHSNINDFNMEKEYKEKKLSRYMCASPEGIIESKICQAQRKSYDMCISQDFTKNVLLEEAEKMITSGLDYIQILDQNHGGTPYFCYSDKHGHPPVPGKWMVEEMKEFLKQLKKKVGNTVLLGCESAASEAYISYLNFSDNRFNLNYMVGKPVPLYGYIYHEYLQNFSGNSVSSLDFIDIHKSPDCHLLRVAHSYLAGDLMTLVINQDGDIVWSWGERDFSILPDKKAVLQFVKSATAYRRGCGKDYLVYGKMIKPCSVSCETVAMHKPNTDYVTEYPAVLTTAWESQCGEKAQFFASYRKQEEKFTLNLKGTNGASLLDESGNIIMELKPEICNLKITPHSVLMIEFL